MSVPVEEFTQDELVRRIKRDQFIKEALATRIAALSLENIELMAIIQELQQTLADLRHDQQTVDQAGPPSNGPSPYAPHPQHQH